MSELNDFYKMCVKNSISRKQHWFLSSRSNDILKEYIETGNAYYEFTLNDYYEILNVEVIIKKGKIKHGNY